MNIYSMKGKAKRLKLIREIIRDERIESQDELKNRLAEKDFEITQATLSRDIRQLQLVKVPDAKGQYSYTLPEDILKAADNQSLNAQSVSIEFSGNLAVVRTRSGYAMGIAFDIDSHAPEEILATIAGDDTILVVPREGFTRTQVINALENYINIE